MYVKDFRVNHSQHKFLDSYQKLVLNKTCDLKLLEQIMKEQFIEKQKQKEK